MSAAATQLAPAPEPRKSLCHHLGAVVTELALGLPLADRSSYLLDPGSEGPNSFFVDLMAQEQAQD